MRPDGRRGERGQSLMFVLVLMASFSVLSLGLLGLVSTASLLNQRVNTPLQERLAADAGVEYGIHQVMEQAAAASFAERKDVLLPGELKRDIVSLTVTEISVTSLTISPPTASVAVGTVVVFTATALNGGVVMDGQAGRPGFAPVWTVTDGNDAGTLSATISQAGRFVATASGTYKVKVVVNNVSAFATVTVL